ncbi:MAG: Asp-tRNA(Asn)/Glu-tRNA(Gln) amidotransferase subunit GatC [Elusimicrobia bacterium]|nr:Asp-tRNA(Asn)/Glu-tRNA(Gln) amidotransferase subunit GatC [Candidatus Liberimonas magnetica]
MKITIKEVEHVAKLARLELSPEEKEKYAGQLEKILEYVDLLNKLDTKDIEPTSHALELENVFREDKLEPCSTEARDRLLANAPEREGDYFKVKKVIE